MRPLWGVNVAGAEEKWELTSRTLARQWEPMAQEESSIDGPIAPSVTVGSVIAGSGVLIRVPEMLAARQSLNHQCSTYWWVSGGCFKSVTGGNQRDLGCKKGKVCITNDQQEPRSLVARAVHSHT